GDLAARIIWGQLLAPAFATLERIEANARNDGREPRFEILDDADIRAADAKPGFLQRVVGLGSRAQHLQANSPQARPSGLEAFR
ncbi:MAG TPA: hypothetical protein VIK27_11350, partial [Candidatus Aquilonibacter sp.]